jgi:lipoate-protein ligase A
MGLDEALLLSHGAPPTLRFYSWKPATLSLGYFQRFAEVRGVQDARVVVRRITGGGAIHHVRELTFSITCDLTHPLYAGSLADSYTQVHRAIASALTAYGIAATLRGATALTSDRADTGMCFHASTPLDLVWNGRKGVGSAQRRTAGRVLHHGSIKLDTSALEGDIASIALTQRGVQPENFAPQLQQAFESVLDLRCEAGVPDPDERASAKELGARFLDPAFVRRR